MNNSKNIHIVKMMLNFLMGILITSNYKYFLINNANDYILHFFLLCFKN